ncbi:aminopeptidase N [Kitasatospora sp. MMS16-BH015]|uniref:aminopeptidase N n=1 Tax=Kitasatospora sp. MMS16-BH015 TaxID=2018025 RepID=UPI000CF22EFB|nr:aminopeptidase N [Kitasatospora sp. MMS16-BH015]
MPALQRAEALTRARLLTVHGYRVELDLTSGAELFGCRTEIRFTCAEPGAGTFLDLRPEVLHRAVLNGRPLPAASFVDGRLALDALAAENELLIETDQRYSRTGEGLHRFADPADGEVYVYANCGPDAAPRVFPCFDQPDLKASFALTVTAPQGWTVIANSARSAHGAGGAGGAGGGGGAGGAGAGGGTAGVVGGAAGRWEFEPTPPISAYLVTLVAGPLHSVYAEHDGIPLGVHARRSLGAALDREAAEMFELTAASFDRMHAVFAERYPFGKYDQAFVPEFNWGAMENPGCVTIADRFVFHAPPTEAERETRAMGVAHEMAHMWFGDLVTMRWWDDLWLNESFAEYLGYRVITEDTRYTEAWTTFGIRRKSWGSDADQRDSTHPVAATGIDSLAEAMVTFDGIAYAKGASAVRQLVAWLGDEVFFAGINEYLSRHRYGNADLADFLAALTDVSGRDVRGWAERWLGTTGLDTLRVETTVAGGVVTRAELVAEGSRPHLAGVGVYDLVRGRLLLRESFEVELAPGGRAVLPKLAGSPAPALVLPNHQDTTWAKIRLDATSWHAVATGLGTVADPLTRAVLWEHARDLVRDGELPPDTYLEMLAVHLPGESADAVVETVLLFARAVVVPTYLPAERRAHGHAVLRRICEAMLALPGAGAGAGTGGRGGSGGGGGGGSGRVESGAAGSAAAGRGAAGRGAATVESRRLVALRGLVENSVGEAGLLWALLDGDREEAGADRRELGVELRWGVLMRLAALGEIDEERIAAELSCEPGDIAQQGAAGARAALPDAASKERAWRAMFTDGELSALVLGGAAAGFWLSGGAELREGYVRRYFEELPDAGRRGDVVMRTLASRLFPVWSVTPETVALAEACLRQDGLTPATRRLIGDQTDDLRRALRVRRSAVADG